MRHLITLWLLLLLTPLCAHAQDLGQIGKKDMLKISGGISANQVFYASSGIQNRRNPYTYVVTGNLNLSIIGFNVPLSFSFSNQALALQQPFNQFSLSPTYKWLTAHVGYSSMSFSPYTLSGHMFYGGGIDATPSGKWKISAMYGRLFRAVEPDSTNEQNQASFERWGYGLKTHYGDQSKFVDIILFRAKDKVSSLQAIPEDKGILPQENLALSLGGGITLAKRIMLKYEITGSALTDDVRSEEKKAGNIFDAGGNLFTARASTSYYKAMKGSIDYNGDGFVLGVGYERVDPKYKTLGAYFFNQDLENITINGNTALLGGKVNLGVSVGRQRDNLDEVNTTTLTRTVASINVGFVPSEKFNISTAYSNFTSFTNIRSPFETINQLTPYDNLDTLNFTQISQNANINASYVISAGKQRQESLNVGFSLMKTGDKQNGVSQPTRTTFFNMNAGYHIGWTEKKINVSPTFNLSRNVAPGSKGLTLGPAVTVSKSINKQSRMSVTANANRSYTESTLTSQVISLRAMGSYTFKKKHQFNLSLTGLNRRGTGMASFNEFTGTLGYALRFK